MASFRKLSTGWEYRIRYKDPFTHQYKERSKRGFATKKEAQLAAANEEKKLMDGYESADISLKNYLENWLNEYKSGSVRKNTFELHKRNIEHHIIPYFKDILLKDLRPIMYQKFLNYLTKQGYSKRTVEIIHGTMYNALEKATILNKIEKNTFTWSYYQGYSKKYDMKFMESKHISTFLQEAYKYDYIYWIFFKVLIETGMRKGEAAALQWTDIDFKNQTIHINKTLDFTAKHEKELFNDPKTYNSVRTITISKSLINDLYFHKKYQNKNKLALNEIYKHNLNLVLCRNDGSIMPKSSLFNAFKRILNNAQLPQIPIHSLRHTHAVLLLESGADMKYVQERLGHGSIQITSDVYAHISEKIEKDSLNKFEDHMNDILNDY
ncbi:integrase [Heyndrickxia ginsengihumi]|uniref:Integrase n=1 Tax=Heyndrickxia ginsengihumi TaxID=363870 RepID=A0A0A6VBP5_9BACI|nr:site-specific integrase [Heyndrickxia ginsengihumi]KHD85660.1 integrase [Heyndrickxia ginsengihumi]